MITVVMVVFILIISAIMFCRSEYYQLTCVVSDVDGHKYCVRDREVPKAAVDLLAKTVGKCNQLIEHLKNAEPDAESTKLLVRKYNPKTIQETLPTSVHTAYSENKGEKIAFCLSKKKNGDIEKESNMIDENTLTFVALHELAHVACVSVGHTDEYWEKFKHLLEHAVKIGIYTPVDYKKEPANYCGMELTDNPYYDM